MAKPLRLDLGTDDEVAPRIAHGDRIEQISRCLRTALFNQLRARAWPQSPSLPQWLDEGYQALLDARRQVEDMPLMRWRGFNVAKIYAERCANWTKSIARRGHYGPVGRGQATIAPRAGRVHGQDARDANGIQIDAAPPPNFGGRVDELLGFFR